MQIFTDLKEWLAFRKTLNPSHSLGFAPTMGNLHPGHASLFLKSQAENDFTAATVFVNPTQFNQQEDFLHYPRTLDADLECMAQAGVDFCILPTQETIYPDNYSYQIQENHLSHRLEGAHRPGHFTGMLTVVMKLLNLIKPHRAYFGEKDYQQYRLIQSMCQAFFMDIAIIPCPIVREPSGLAYSSRNNRLTLEEKKLAEQFVECFHQEEKTCVQIKKKLEHLGIRVDYVEDDHGRRLAAVWIGDIRLIDNYKSTRR